MHNSVESSESLFSSPLNYLLFYGVYRCFCHHLCRFWRILYPHHIRHVLTGNEFRGTCATNNPMLKDQVGECTVCGKKPGEECQMPEVGKA